MPIRGWSTIYLAGALALSAQSVHDPADVLAHARPRILETIERLPKYTCTQTVNRSYLQSLAPLGQRLSCDDLVALKRQGEIGVFLAATDRLRLDVAVGDGGSEIYSWAGASRMESDSMDQVIGGGPSGTGTFGSFLIDIFNQPGIDFHFLRDLSGPGQISAMEYRFQVPAGTSHYGLLYGGRAQVFPYDGTFRVASDSAELQNLTVRTGELPNDSGVCEATTAVDFKRTRVGAGEYLLPVRSSLRFLRRNGDETENITSFSSCREYHGEAAIRFDAADSTGAAAKNPAPQPAPPLPRGLTVRLSLLADIDTATAAAGDPVSARVADPVLDLRTRKVVVPAGSLVRGRLTRLEHRREQPSYFLIAIDFTSVESHGVTEPFAARLKHPFEFVNGGKLEIYDYWDRAVGNGTLVFQTRDEHYVIPRGFEWDCITGASKN